MKTRNLKSGFTLIEIVMVLVLIGILAAVAAPKYFDLQKTAKEKSAQAAVAEIQARVNQAFAKELLDGNSCSEALKTAKGEATSTLGDWTLSYTDGTDSATVSAEYAGDTITKVNSKDLTIYYPKCNS